MPDNKIFTIPSVYTHMLPGYYLRALDRYFNERIPTGGFLQAVLENDLTAAVRRMNPPSWDVLTLLLELLSHDDCPSKAWGSPEKVEAWLRQQS